MAKTAVKTDAELTADNNQPPVFKARLGAQQIAMWENRAVDTKGEERLYQTFTLERGYTDKDGDWVNEKLRFNAREIGSMIALLQSGQQALVKTK